MGKQADIRKEPAEPCGIIHLITLIIFSLLLPVLPPTELSNFRPQSKMIYSNGWNPRDRERPRPVLAGWNAVIVC